MSHHNDPSPPYTPPSPPSHTTQHPTQPPTKQARNATPQPLLLHIYHGALTHSHTQGLAPDKTTPLYNVENRYLCKPHLTFLSPTNALIGTATFPSCTSTIKLVLHDSPLSLTSIGLFKSGHEYTSPYACPGEKLTWKSAGLFSGRDLVLLDENSMPVARFVCSSWSMRKSGTIEIGPVAEGRAMDEVVLGGLAMVELMRRRQRSSAGGGGS